MMVIKVLILATLMLIFLQDILSRSVHWFLFPVLAVLFIITNLLQHRFFTDMWQPVVLNCALLLFQVLLLSLYFSVKNITTGLLGWGDILFLFSIAFYLSVLNFLFFYITSLTVILLVWALWQLASKAKNKQIPLAGFQALLFIFILAYDWWYKSFDLTNDNWLLNVIMK